MKRLASLVFTNVPTVIQTSETRKPTYYYENKGLPKKFARGFGFYYEWRDGVLWDIHKNERVIRNLDSLDKPRTVSINGNNLQGVLHGGSKAQAIKIKQELKSYFINQLYRKPKVTIRTFPVILETKLYINLSNMRHADEDNIMQFYTKALRDSIKEFFISTSKGSMLTTRQKTIVNPKGIIPDDNLNYVIGGNTRIFHTELTPYMILNFYNYESAEEERLDYDNQLKLQSNETFNGKLAKAAHTLTVEQLKVKFRTSKLTTEDGEIKDEYMSSYQITYEYFFDLLSNELL